MSFPLMHPVSKSPVQEISTCELLNTLMLIKPNNEQGQLKFLLSAFVIICICQDFINLIVGHQLGEQLVVIRVFVRFRNKQVRDLAAIVMPQRKGLHIIMT